MQFRNISIPIIFRWLFGAAIQPGLVLREIEAEGDEKTPDIASALTVFNLLLVVSAYVIHLNYSSKLDINFTQGLVHILGFTFGYILKIVASTWLIYWILGRLGIKTRIPDALLVAVCSFSPFIYMYLFSLIPYEFGEDASKYIAAFFNIWTFVLILANLKMGYNVTLGQALSIILSIFLAFKLIEFTLF
ncbi:MAG: YIP1 family protein [Bacteroidota bacterium]